MIKKLYTAAALMVAATPALADGTITAIQSPINGSAAASAIKSSAFGSSAVGIENNFKAVNSFTQAGKIQLFASPQYSGFGNGDINLQGSTLGANGAAFSATQALGMSSSLGEGNFGGAKRTVDSFGNISLGVSPTPAP